MLHKALELLARRKLAEQRGEREVVDPEVEGGRFSVEEITPELAVNVAYRHYEQLEPFHNWTDKDHANCHLWLGKVLDYQDGLYDPRKRDVLAPEQFFEFQVEEDWGRFDYLLPSGRKIQGRLRLHGTMDLVTALSREPLVIEYCDWKSGRFINWDTGKPKTVADLYLDPQLHIYFWALTVLYPQAEAIFMTPFYVNDGGPFSICLTKNDLPKSKQLVRERFEAIKHTQRPTRIVGDQKQQWKCRYLCEFYSKTFEGSKKNICDGIHDEILQLGLDKVTENRCDFSKLGKYQDGGGRRAKQE